MTLSADLMHYLQFSAVGIGDLAIGDGALDRLHDIVGKLPAHDTIIVLTDETNYVTSAGQPLKALVREILCQLGEVEVIELRGDVHADETTVQSAIDAARDVDVVVTVGSGTLSDIGKVAASGHSHVVVQTAASVNGFADNQSVLLIKGVKRTTHSAWPTALVVDSSVLQGAPVEMNRSGLGDMISMFTAPADWYLSSLVGMDGGWSKEPALMTRRYGETLLNIAPAIGSADPDSLTTLAEFVTLSGISMGVAGQTSPSSGMEHTVSHLLDMANGARGKANAYHGAQVGVATVVASILWRRMRRKLAEGRLGEITLPSNAHAESAVRAAFDWMDGTGATSDECWADYSKKLAILREGGMGASIRNASLNWAAHDAILGTILESPERIVQALRSAGAPVRFSELNHVSDPDDIVWAFTHCHLMRNRFTIADLAYLSGAWTHDDVTEALLEAEHMGAGL